MQKTLVALVCLAMVSRLVVITRVPVSLNWDEAAFGYNAYSLLLTGRDEYGIPLPWEFKSVGDYKPPMYMYMLVPSIAVFGLTEWAVRLVPAVMGVCAVIGFYIVVVTVTGRKDIAWWTSLVLTISPWHLQFTRAGTEAAIATAWVVLGTAAFVRKRWIISAVAFAATIYSYFSERMFVPLWVLALVVCGYPVWKRHIRQVIWAVVVGLVCMLPAISLLFSAGHKNKILITTLLSYTLPETETGPKVIAYARIFFDQYLNHFSPSFLFIQGPPDNRQRIEGMGMLYWVDVAMLPIGLWVWYTKMRGKKYSWLFVVWLLLAPLPAAVTKDAVHARRALNMVYPLSFALGLGWWSLLNNVRRGLVPLSGTIIALSAMVWSVLWYGMSYYNVTPLLTYKGPGGWHAGYKELVTRMLVWEEKYDQIIVDTSYQGPYLYFLLYRKYPPAKYHPQAKLNFKDPSGLGEGAGFDKYEFRDVNWQVDRDLLHQLIVAPPEKFPKNFDERYKYIDTVYFPDGNEAFRLVEAI